MADYIRRLVSGQKARFKDDELKVEFDLVYVTDQIIIMGYPASGFEGYYRNRREDVKKFLDHRHGQNYWIFNFCPLGENSYESSEFEGRVSRYPFPDHHAPPLAIMPLMAREMKAWLECSPERVAVLHCKAGKGRSGTMACAYLLSLDGEPTPPRLERSHTTKEWAKKRANETMEALYEEPLQEQSTPSMIQAASSLTSESETSNTHQEETEGSPLAGSPGPVSPTGANPHRSFTDTLKTVLDLHTARRMKTPSDPLKKQKQGVSIPSQRRFLYYWALCLAHEAPPEFWSLTSPPTHIPSNDLPDAGPRKLVRLTQIKLRLRELSPVKFGLVKAANMIIDKAKGGSPLFPSSPSMDQEQRALLDHSSHANHIWISLARYDDEFVDTLEQWEIHTRDKQGKMGIRKPGLAHRTGEAPGEEEHLAAMFQDGRWDKHKMVRCFARLGEVGKATRTESRGIDKEEKISTYTLQPLTRTKWEGIKKDLQADSMQQAEQVNTQAYDLPADEAHSLSDVESQPMPRTASSSNATQGSPSDSGVILNAEREVRIKLYMGQVFMGWIWLIPAFHMPPSSPHDNNDNGATSMQTTIRLTRKEVDFPIGLGTGIVDVEISLESLRLKHIATTPKRSDKNWDAFCSLVVDDQYAK